MIEISGVLRPSTSKEASSAADLIQQRIDEAREAVTTAQAHLLAVCVEQYPVGSRVQVNVAARRNPEHEVVAVNEHGWLTLRNCQTGTERGMMADSWTLSPSRCWYERMERAKEQTQTEDVA